MNYKPTIENGESAILMRFIAERRAVADKRHEVWSHEDSLQAEGAQIHIGLLLRIVETQALALSAIKDAATQNGGTFKKSGLPLIVDAVSEKVAEMLKGEV